MDTINYGALVRARRTLRDLMGETYINGEMERAGLDARSCGQIYVEAETAAKAILDVLCRLKHSTGDELAAEAIEQACAPVVKEATKP